MRALLAKARLRRKPAVHRPPVVLFDFDGVVADSFEVFYEEFTSAVKQLGYDKLDSRESLLKLMEGNAIKGLVKLGFPVWKLKQLGEQFAPKIQAANERVLPFEGMVALITEMAAVHPTYVITSNQTAAVERFIEKHGIVGVRGVLGADKEPSKVKKIRSVRKRYPTHQAWYIGDTKGDMIEANHAGAISIAVGWGWHSVDKLLEGKPTHVAHTQDTLRELLLPSQPESHSAAV